MTNRRSIVGLIVVGAVIVGMAPIATASTYGGPGRIAYVDYGNGTYQHIWSMNANGSDKVDLMPTSAEWNDHPAWSPDGGSIAFARGTSRSNADIWVMDADGGNPVQLSLEPGTGITPSWSSDGETIVYVVYDILTDSRTITTMSALDGSNSTPLVEGENPSFSPNDAKIVFARWRQGYSDIFVMDADGTDVTNLTRTRSLSEFNPDWSPDGRTIVFQRSLNGEHEIFTTDPAGRREYRITKNRLFDGFPSFSPDGTRILLAREGDTFSMNASGSEPRRLADRGAESNSADWQPTPCTIEGTSGDDDLDGTGGDDVICGYGGDDVIRGLGGDDVLLGGGGADLLNGGGGADTLAGAGQEDRLLGGSGADRLTGDGGKDIHSGGAGPDYLFTWDRTRGDRLNCGPGRDRWAYETGDIVNC